MHTKTLNMTLIYFDKVNDITFPRDGKRLLNYVLIGDKMQEGSIVSCNVPKRALVYSSLSFIMYTRKLIVIIQTFTN